MMDRHFRVPIDQVSAGIDRMSVTKSLVSSRNQDNVSDCICGFCALNPRVCVKRMADPMRARPR